jgi:hypothetical protein
MDTREGRIRGALEGLAAEGVVAPGQVEPITRAVRDALAEPVRGARWTEIVSYAGGALVLAGAVAVLGPAWGDLSRGARFTLLGLITLVLLGFALTVRRKGSSPRLRLTGVLWTLGAGSAALAAAQLASEHQTLTGAAAGLVVAVSGYVLFPGAAGLLAVGGFGVTVVGALLDLMDVRSALLQAFAVIALGVVFAAFAATGVVGHRVLGMAIGSALALVGGQWPLIVGESGVWPYLVTGLIAVGCLVLYAREKTWVLIVAGIAGSTAAVAEAIWDLTDGALGGALMTVLTGFILLGAGVLGLSWHRKAPENTC